MPINRCIIKNEYNLGDPDLYNNNNKDDPEGLLEGVAMSGLVGLLRQLGDLAQFAAEIFHDLHEEVMATAARGHCLTVRVQQLESEFPVVERKLLFQTSHTSLLYNPGIDWHPNPRMDQNLVASGDLPRFVMDSYEECRGPPRLFLLDKFDVAGAGACLKRFTDPSFFKAESTSSSGRNSGQREKKTRKVKKRGPRWRNGDTPESFPTSHAKLHQLFLEESIETGGCDPQRRVKLKKKQLSGSQFNHDKGKSYMEKILDIYTPKQNDVHDVCIDALALTWRPEDDCESVLETEKSGSSLSNTMERVKPLMDGQELGNGESKSEVTVDDGRGSDDGTSEMDNYMDALATIESEVETDSECNRNTCYSNLRPIVVDSDPSEEKRDLQSYDSHSVGNSMTSEDSSNFFKERKSATCSVSMDSLADTTTDLDHRGSNMDVEKLSVDEPGAHVKMSNVSSLTHENTMLVQGDDGTSMKSYMPNDYASGLRDQEHVNPTASWSFSETGPNARDMTNSGHSSHQDFPMRALTDASDGLVDKPQIELKHSDLDAPSLMCQPISDTMYTTDGFVAPVIDPSTEEEAELALSAAPGNLSTVETGPSEIEDQYHKPSIQVNSRVEPSRMNLCSEIAIEELPVDSSGDECKDALNMSASESNAVYQDISHSNGSKPVETFEHSVTSVNKETYTYDTSDYCSRGDSSSLYADAPKQDHNNYYHENSILVPSSSSFCTHKVHELPRSVIKGSHINEGELTSCLVAELVVLKNLNTDLDGPVHSNGNMYNANENVLLDENDDSISNSQAKQEVEDYAQPVYPRGFPVLGVGPAEPPINLDAPPLPPLPPMQWRLSRFQNSSEPSQRSTEQHNVGFIIPVLATASEVASQNNENKLRTDNDLSFTTSTSAISHRGTHDGYVTQEGVHTQPMLASSPDIIDGFRREDDLSFTTPTSAISHCETQDGYVTQEGVHTQPMFSSVSEVASPDNTNEIIIEDGLLLANPESTESRIDRNPEQSDRPTENHDVMLDVKVDGDVNDEDEQHELITQIPEPLENSQAQVPPPVTQPPPGFVGMMWPGTHDGMMNNVDGNGNGTLQKKIPRPRNPLIDEVVAIDKTKLRKVERVKPTPEPRSETGESILEQMQLRKVERIKPPTDTKADEISSLLENLQLRKVGVRVKPQIEQNTEVSNSLLGQVQLRKVGDGVKPPVGPTTKEREEFLEQLQLRKVGERVRSEVECSNKSERPKEREFLEQLQLRKVGESVKSEGECNKTEETGSPRVQLRKVEDRFKSEIELKPEETESPRVQLRKVGERTRSLAVSRTQDRDSLLEQIRNKSFNLKPADVGRPKIQPPNIQGPRTNLKVVAIIEKASNIRQAMAGSDEEDDTDAWE